MVIVGVGWANVSHANPCSSVVAVNCDGLRPRYRYMTACLLCCCLSRYSGRQPVQRYESPRFICTQHAFQPPMARCAAQVARACPIQIIRLLLLPPTPMSPCPRRPSPDTASTFALAQGQQEGDKRRARAQGQGRAQVPDAAPTPVNHTSRTRQALHRGLPLRCYFGTHCRSLFILSHYRNTGEGGLLHWTLSLGNP